LRQIRSASVSRTGEHYRRFAGFDVPEIPARRRSYRFGRACPDELRFSHHDNARSADFGRIEASLKIPRYNAQMTARKDSPRPLVAFDEAGNTGQALLDPQQPVFVLASVHVSEGRAQELIAPLVPKGAREAKFSGRRGTLWERAVLALFDEPEITNAQVKLSVYHKSFLATTKIVDLLIEQLLHQSGFDLYENAGNLALANVLHLCTPAFCGVAPFEELQRRFVEMVREKAPETIRAFYRQVARLRKLNTEDDFDDKLGLLAATAAIAHDAFPAGDITAIDPALPAFVDLAGQWTAELGCPFDVAHDPSKPMSREQESVELLMTEAEPPRNFARNGPPTMLPLRATGIRFVESHSLPQIQLADIVAGAAARVMRGRARGKLDDFAQRIIATRFGQLGYVPIWPTAAVTPAELGADKRSGSDGLKYTMELRERESRRRGRQ